MAGILHQVAEFPIDQVYLYTRHPYLGLQPEKNKLVVFGKNGFFAKKTQLEKNRSKFCFFFIFKHLFTFYCFLNYKKMANCAYIMPRTWITRHFNTGKKNLFM